MATQHLALDYEFSDKAFLILIDYWYITRTKRGSKECLEIDPDAIRLHTVAFCHNSRPAVLQKMLKSSLHP